MMEIDVDKNVIGKKVSMIYQSPVTDAPSVVDGVITGIYVDKDKKTHIRFGESKWIAEEYIFEPHESAVKLKEFKEKYK